MSDDLNWPAQDRISSAAEVRDEMRQELRKERDRADRAERALEPVMAALEEFEKSNAASGCFYTAACEARTIMKETDE